MRGATVVVKCQRCKQSFAARVADRKRGWGRFCSKSCKAIRQTQRTGYVGPNSRYECSDEGGGFQMSQADLAAGGYGDADWNTPFHEGKT
jgi:hypothetical protein